MKKFYIKIYYLSHNCNVNNMNNRTGPKPHQGRDKGPQPRLFIGSLRTDADYMKGFESFDFFQLQTLNKSQSGSGPSCMVSHPKVRQLSAAKREIRSPKSPFGCVNALRTRIDYDFQSLFALIPGLVKISEICHIRIFLITVTETSWRNLQPRLTDLDQSTLLNVPALHTIKNIFIARKIMIVEKDAEANR